jgi:hypothetical protein
MVFQILFFVMTIIKYLTYNGFHAFKKEGGAGSIIEIVECGQTYFPVILEVPGATIISKGVAVNVSK